MHRVAGVLHHQDLAGKYSLQSRPEDDKPGRQVIRKGTELKLFVKQVFANSGKYTLTTDPKVSKADLDKEKMLRKRAASARRLQRRLRRHLDALKEGDELPAVVDRVSGSRVLLLLQITPTVKIPAFAGVVNLPPSARPAKSLSPDMHESFLNQIFRPGTHLPVRIKSKTAVGVIVDILSAPGQGSSSAASANTPRYAYEDDDEDYDDDDHGDGGDEEGFDVDGNSDLTDEEKKRLMEATTISTSKFFEELQAIQASKEAKKDSSAGVDSDKRQGKKGEEEADVIFRL